MKKSQFARSLVALILVLASLISIVPVVFATEEAGERESVEVDLNDYFTEEEETSELELDQTEIDEPETEEYIVPELEELLALNDRDYDTDVIPEYDPVTKDVRGPNYVFLDFMVGSASRNFNWQIKSDAGSATEKNTDSNRYFAANIQGQLAVDIAGSDGRVYMPIETHDSGLERLGSYVLQSGDIIQVRIGSVHDTINDGFTSDGTSTLSSYFAIRTSADKTAWQSCGNANLVKKTGGQTLQFKVASGQVGKTLYGVRWDPSQSDIAETRFYIDYIYVGPAASAPVSVQFFNQNGSGYSGGYGYVGKGKKPMDWNHGQTDSETTTTQSIWGWTVHQYKDGAWVDLKTFITDPSTMALNYNTRFYLKQVTIRKQTLSSTQVADNGVSTDDDKYTLTIDGFDTAEMELGSYGKPIDLSIVLDRSGSMADIVASSTTCTTYAQVKTKLAELDMRKWPGYYRASFWRRKKSDGGSGAAAYIYTMPLRYHRGQWQMLVVKSSCNCNSGYHDSYGIYTYLSSGMQYCSHTGWVDMETAFNLFCDYRDLAGYSTGMKIGVSRLGRTQSAISDLLVKLYQSNVNLPKNTNHTVSIVSFGSTVFGANYPYYDQNSKWKTSNNMDLCKASVAWTYSNYEAMLRCIRDPYVHGSTRTDSALQVLSGERSYHEKEAGQSATTFTKTDFIPANSSSRKKVVLILTDGCPTNRSDGRFVNDIATDAIDASRRFGNNNYTTVYTVGILTGLDASTYYKSAWSQEDEESDTKCTQAERCNNFLNLLSSRYKAATAYNEAGTKTAGDYFFAGTSAGGSIATQLSTLWDSEAPSLKPSGKSGPASLWLYEEFSREWKPDPTRPVRIYAAPYTGNGTYGDKVLIGEHVISSWTTDQVITGKGYKLHITAFTDTQKFAYTLQWQDAKKAFLRETELDLGCAATPISGTLNTKKGYKVFLEMPIEVDRNNTMGGNNIPLTVSASGCYQANSAADTAKGSKLFNYAQPNANVFCTVGADCYDYFISLEDYVALFNNNTGKLQTILDSMVRMPDNLKPANDKGLSNLDYVSFDVHLKAPDGTTMIHKAAALHGTTMTTNIDTVEDAQANLLQDQMFTLVAVMENATSNTDSFGRAPYPNVNTTLYPTYYVPKFAVVDYGDDICVPMGMEGQNHSRISGLPAGALDTATNEVKFDDGGVLVNEVTSLPYTYTTVNTPKGESSNVVAREVIILPGNVVTYDDDVLTYAGAAQLSSKTEKWTSKITGKEKSRTIIENRVAWSTLGTKTDIVQTYDNTTSHGGYDAKYATTGYFHGSTMVATVGETSTYDTDGELIEKVSNSTAQTQFTFKGTGFEVISRTTMDSGVLLAEVFSGTSIGADATPVKSILCNTYLSTADYNQAPVIRWTGDYGDYTVRLTAYYNVAFAFRSAKDAVTEEEARAILGYDDSVDFTYIASKDPGTSERGLVSSYNVYVDGIRVFNPLNTGTEMTRNIYSLSQEGYASFGDIQNIVLDATTWKGGTASGMLFLADRNSNIGNNAQDEQLSSEIGFPLFMNGTLSYEKVGEKTYFLDQSGNRIKDPATGCEIYSVCENGSYKYRVDKASGSNPYTSLSRDYVRSVLVDYSGYFYNKIYRSYGAKNEVQLQNGQGVAFAADASALHLSLKSANGTAVKVQVWDGSAFVDYKDPKGNTPLTALTSTTEMFFDFSQYKGTVIIKNAGSGILSICQAKYVEDGASSMGIYVDNTLALAAMKAFDEAQPAVTLDSLKLSHSLNLRSNIGINYILPKAAMADFDHYALTCTVGQETFTLTGTENGEMIYFTLDCLTAAQMNDNVTAVLTATKGEETYVSPVDDYSIASYAFTMMNKEGVSQAVKTLCASLLRYGAATQTFLGKTESGLADEELTAEQRAWLCDLESVVLNDNFAILEDMAEPMVTWFGKTLALDSTVAVKLVVDASAYAGDPAELELRVAYTDIDGEAKELTLAPTVYNADKSLYLFTLDRLDAADLRAVLTCRVFAAGEAVSQTMTYSADSYGTGKTGTLLDLCKALFAYVDAAKAVFAN